MLVSVQNHSSSNSHQPIKNSLREIYYFPQSPYRSLKTLNDIKAAISHSKNQGKIIKIGIENLHNSQTFKCNIQQHTQKSLKKFNILPLQIANKIFFPVRRPLRIQKLYLILIIFLKE